MRVIGFVILHYGDIHVTDRCVQSILTMEQQERIRIVIVDNDVKESLEDHRDKWIKYRDLAGIEVLQLRKSNGFSSANNVGYSYIRKKMGASVVIISNNDIIFEQKDFIFKLDCIMQKQDCHVLGPAIIRLSTGEHQSPMDTRVRTKKEADLTIRMNRFALRFYPVLYPLLYLQNRYSEKRNMLQRKKNIDYYSHIHQDIILFGACLIFMPDFIENETKAFFPETEFYYEEYLLALRCSRKGYKVLYDPSLIVFHDSGDATKKTFGSEYKRLRFVVEKTLKACEIYRYYTLGKVIK